MNTETLITFFTKKLEQVPDLKNLNDSDAPDFVAWWNSITSTCARMGQAYQQKANGIYFSPRVIFAADNRTVNARAYQRGLNEAESFIKSIIEELKLWGFGAGHTKSEGVSMPAAQDKVILNLTISQQQIQQITQTINLSQYDQDVQDKVQELLAELKKETKDKSKIVNAVKWLADKSVDALIAVLLASSNLAQSM